MGGLKEPRNCAEAKVVVECANLVMVDCSSHRIRMPFLTCTCHFKDMAKDYSKHDGNLARVRSLSSVIFNLGQVGDIHGVRGGI